MFLSIATTHQPATDLGYLLHRHPERLYETALNCGAAWVFYPESGDGLRRQARRAGDGPSATIGSSSAERSRPTPRR